MGTSQGGTQPAAVVFDMDGTLLDSETLARAYFEQACLDVYQAVDMCVYDRCVGATWEATETLMRESYGPAFPFEVVDQALVAALSSPHRPNSGGHQAWHSECCLNYSVNGISHWL